MDVGTREISPKNKKKVLPWVEGPKFLQLPESEWPIFPRNVNPVLNMSALFIIPVDVKHVLKIENVNVGERILLLITYYSDFNRMVHSFCYLFSVFKSWLIKDISKRKLFLNLKSSPLTVKGL